MAIKILSYRKDLTMREVIDAINKLYEAAYYSNALLTMNDFGKTEPPTGTYGVSGLVAYANGVDWNPGSSGAGFYRWAGAWVRIG